MTHFTNICTLDKSSVVRWQGFNRLKRGPLSRRESPLLCDRCAFVDLRLGGVPNTFQFARLVGIEGQRPRNKATRASVGLATYPNVVGLLSIVRCMYSAKAQPRKKRLQTCSVVTSKY